MAPDTSWHAEARRIYAESGSYAEVSRQTGKSKWLVTKAITEAPPAERMHARLEESQTQGTLYFAESGEPIQTKVSAPQSFAFVIHWPFRPSLASLEDMVAEHRTTGRQVIYDEARWEADPRIEEQAGPSVLEQVRIDAEALMQRLAA